MTFGSGPGCPWPPGTAWVAHPGAGAPPSGTSLPPPPHAALPASCSAGLGSELRRREGVSGRREQLWTAGRTGSEVGVQCLGWGWEVPRGSPLSSVSVSPSCFSTSAFSSSSGPGTSRWLWDTSLWIFSTDFSKSLQSQKDPFSPSGPSPAPWNWKLETNQATGQIKIKSHPPGHQPKWNQKARPQRWDFRSTP